MDRSRLLLGIAALAGCYSPEVRDCAISCAASSCPGGYTCEQASGLCRVAGATGSCEGGDGGMTIDSGPPPCWGGFSPTNYDPCAAAFPPVGPLQMIDAPASIDTDTGILTMSGATSVIGAPYVFDVDPVMLVHVTSLAITAHTQVTGSLPLLVVADGQITIAAAIDASTATGVAYSACTYQTLPDTSPDGRGGQGGGYGGNGGRGGDGNDGGTAVTGPLGVPANGNPSIAPLRVGCIGAAGATSAGVGAGSGGSAGGAIELSAQSSIVMTVASAVYADGGHGGNGTSTGADASGGGGGGAGGAIIIEAPMLTFDAGAQLCAVGGGGGGGGEDGTTVAAALDGSQCTPGSGGGTHVIGGAGGGANDGGPGDNYNVNFGAGPGGGGGAAGRVHLHGSSTSPPYMMPPGQ